ncbi:MAG TPA: tetratricopeptide repeat protein [Ilumatobacteraceae bacterium]
MTGVDSHNNPMTGTEDTIALYDRAIDRLIRFHPAVIDLAGELTSGDEVAPMANALMAYLNLMSTDADDLVAVRAAWQALTDSDANDRERAHAAAIGAWLNGGWTEAAALLDDLLLQWPTDVLALMIGHQLDFFLGDAGSLRDRPLRCLPQYSADDPHIAFVRGMASFGLEEAGHYGQALDTGLAAVAANPDDVWGIHAVVHTYEMQGRVDEGIGFLTSDATRWENGNLFTVHNWWHLALYHLEAGEPQQSLAIYDSEIHHAESAGVPIEMLDASALLWRLMLDGVDTGDRFAVLAEAWAAKSHGDPWYAFNDLHAAMALAAADRLDEAKSLIAARQRWLGQQPAGTNARMTAEIGLPACRAAVAFVERRHDDVIAELMPIRRVFNHFGGSHAQRDALQRTLLESAIRANRWELARGLTAERLGLRESSVYGWTQWARVLNGLGDATGAASATNRAAELRQRFRRVA